MEYDGGDARETGAAAQPATDYGPWGGSLSFDSDTSWHFGIDTLPASNRSDFLSVALHEIGHALGLAGTSPSWDTYQVGATFTGPNAVLVHGRAVATVSTTDNHWAEDTMSVIFGTNIPQEAAMDPDVTTGTRKFFTELDVASLRDVGWEVIPEPGSAALLLNGGAMVALRRRRRGC